MTNRGVTDGTERAGMIAGIALILLLVISGIVVVSIFTGIGL
jgi:hypothetical protein